MKVAFIDTVHPKLKEALLIQHFEICEWYHLDRAQILNQLSDIKGLVIRSRIKIDRDFLAEAKQLKFIARFGAGMENIDVTYAESLGIQCLNAPEGNKQAVAEHALAMLLSLFNKLPKATQEVKNNIWLREQNRGEELQGKTVGIIGYGNTGSAFAKVLQGFGVKIVAHDKYKTHFGNDYVHEASLEEIKKESDVISLHLPQSEETKNYVNQSFINDCKKPFWLINTARGSCVHTEDLLQALETQKIRGAALDVLEYEKSSFENLNHYPDTLKKLLHRDDVIISPHIAGWSHQSNEKMADILAEKIKAIYY